MAGNRYKPIETGKSKSFTTARLANAEEGRNPLQEPFPIDKDKLGISTISKRNPFTITEDFKKLQIEAQIERANKLKKSPAVDDLSIARAEWQNANNCVPTIKFGRGSE